MYHTRFTICKYGSWKLHRWRSPLHLLSTFILGNRGFPFCLVWTFSAFFSGPLHQLVFVISAVNYLIKAKKYLSKAWHDFVSEDSGKFSFEMTFDPQRMKKSKFCEYTFCTRYDNSCNVNLSVIPSPYKQKTSTAQFAAEVFLISDSHKYLCGRIVFPNEWLNLIQIAITNINGIASTFQ